MIFATFEFFDVRCGILDVLHVLIVLQLVVVLSLFVMLDPDLASESRPTPDFFTCFAFPSGTSYLSFDSPSDEVSSLELQTRLNP